VNKTVSQDLIDPEYTFVAASLLSYNGYIDRSKEILKDLLVKDPRNLNALNLLAEISERGNQIEEAIYYRELILKLDPWNARNLLQLGREYKFVGDFNAMNDMKTKILSFASQKPEAQLADAELVQ
jgi:tetratricopeptide (TPR) repeat protein